jgi:hypothetical protein
MTLVQLFSARPLTITVAALSRSTRFYFFMITLHFNALPYHNNKPYKLEEICRTHTHTLKPGVHKLSKKLAATLKFYACSMFHTEDPQILGITIKNLVTMMTWHLTFVHP